MTLNVSQIPFDELQIGQKVIGANGVPGVISNLQPITEDYRKEDNLVSFKWENDKESPAIWHFWCDKVMAVEQGFFENYILKMCDKHQIVYPEFSDLSARWKHDINDDSIEYHDVHFDKNLCFVHTSVKFNVRHTQTTRWLIDEHIPHDVIENLKKRFPND